MHPPRKAHVGATTQAQNTEQPLYGGKTALDPSQALKVSSPMTSESSHGNTIGLSTGSTFLRGSRTDTSTKTRTHYVQSRQNMNFTTCSHIYMQRSLQLQCSLISKEPSLIRKSIQRCRAVISYARETRARIVVACQNGSLAEMAPCRARAPGAERNFVLTDPTSCVNINLHCGIQPGCNTTTKLQWVSVRVTLSGISYLLVISYIPPFFCHIFETTSILISMYVATYHYPCPCSKCSKLPVLVCLCCNVVVLCALCIYYCLSGCWLNASSSSAQY